MPPRHPLLQKCIAQLDALPNLKVTINAEPMVTADGLADGQLTLQSANDTVNYICQLKQNVNGDSIGQIIHDFKALGNTLHPHQRPLLITQGLSTLAIDQLLDHNMEFIEVDGSLYLNSPAAYILVRPPLPTTSASLSEITVITPNSLKVTYAILATLRPNHLSINLNDSTYLSQLRDVAGVDSQDIHATLETLQTLKYVRQDVRGEGHHAAHHDEIVDYLQLLEWWERCYGDSLRPQLQIGTFSLSKGRNFSDIQEQIKALAGIYHYWIGGELGAAIKTRRLRPIGATLHLEADNYRRLAVELRLKPDPNGTIVLLKSFGTRKTHCSSDRDFETQRLAHPILIHAELMQSDDSRLRETAHTLYEQYLEGSFQPL